MIPSPTAVRCSRSVRVLAALGFCLIAAGCSGSSSDTAPVTTTAPSTTAPSTTTSTTEATTTTELPEARPLPSDEAGLTAAISEAELAIRDEANSSEVAASWGRRLQRLYRIMADNEEWAAGVMAGVDPAIAVDVESNWSARQHLSALVTSTKLAENMPAWRIDEPLPVDELVAAYKSAEAETGVPWELLASINFIETRMGRIEGLSTAGAVGPMQFMPSTWEGCCEGDPTIDADAILGAAVYLTQVGAPGDIDGALFSYNRSTDYVEAVKDYAAVIERNELAYRGYHAYDVFFRSAAGLVVLRPGYYEPEPVDAVAWIAANPDALLSN